MLSGHKSTADGHGRLGERQSLPDNGEVARIPEAVLDSLRERLERRPEILEAYLFGSHARGEAMPHSDIDIAVYFTASTCRRLPGGMPPSSLPT